ILDYAVGALSLFLIVSLDVAGRIAPVALLTAVTLGSLTYSLSTSGARPLLPLIVPPRLWDRANALHSMAYAVTGAAGPALAGGFTAWLGPEVGLSITAALSMTGNVWLAAAAAVFVGVCNGPADIALFSMRQRRTDPAWYGRAFAVSMSLNFAGTPLGSAISGPLIQVGLTFAIAVSAGFLLLAAVLVPLVIPPGYAGTMVPE